MEKAARRQYVAHPRTDTRAAQVCVGAFGMFHLRDRDICIPMLDQAKGDAKTVVHATAAPGGW